MPVQMEIMLTGFKTASELCILVLGEGINPLGVHGLNLA